MDPILDYAYAGIRIVSGLLFACHGAQKLFGVLDANSAELLSLRGAAGVIEFFGGALIRSACSSLTSLLSPVGRWPLPIFSRTRRGGSGRS